MIGVVLIRAALDVEAGHADAPLVLDPGSLVALSQAIAWRRGVADARLLGICCGPRASEGPLREAMALGLDDAVRVAIPDAVVLGVSATAAALVKVIPDGVAAILAGRQSSDHGTGALPGALASLLDWPLLPEVMALQSGPDGTLAKVRADVGRHLTFRVDCAAVYVAAALAAPSLYPPLARRLAAQRATIPVVQPGANEEPGFQVLGYGPARPRTRRLLKPEASARAGDRLSQLMSAGMASRSGQVTQSDAEALSQMLVAVLDREHLLPARLPPSG